MVKEPPAVAPATFTFNSMEENSSNQASTLCFVAVPAA
jgi:hypothetical protein